LTRFIKCLGLAALSILLGGGHRADAFTGDLNRDHQITLADAQIALRYAVGLEPMDPVQARWADVVKVGTSAGRVDLADVIRLLRHTVGAQPFTLAERVRVEASPLNEPGDLDPLMERVGGSHFVLLGEASHGTHEYYQWRSAIAQRLIREEGFTYIAVEGDWPDLYQVNAYVKGLPGSGGSAFEVLNAFRRWPTWMWSNREIEELVEWLKAYNVDQPEERKVGVYGLDLYSPLASLDQVVRYTQTVGGAAFEAARAAQDCLAPYGEGLPGYVWAPATCEDAVTKMDAEVQKVPPGPTSQEREAYFNARQNALVVKDAERYYRTLSFSDSWNQRDSHMVGSLNGLVQHLGPDAKGMLWEHNTHIGDARATDMADYGEVNVGQLVRQRYGMGEVVAVGLSSHTGSVIAADGWGAPMKSVPVPPGREGSWEAVMREAGAENKLLLLTDRQGNPVVSPEFSEVRGHRAIGVVYDPDFEAGNYVPTVLPRRYDVFLYLDETQALRPLQTDPTARQ